MSQCGAAPNTFKCCPAESMALEVPSSQKLPSPQGLRASAPGSALGKTCLLGTKLESGSHFLGFSRRWVCDRSLDVERPARTRATFPDSTGRAVPVFHLCSSRRNRDAVHWTHGSESWHQANQCPTWVTRENHSLMLLTWEHLNRGVETLLHSSGDDALWARALAFKF